MLMIYELHGMFNPGLTISLWGYNVETILAEKCETILRRGVLSTRPRDFYDVYIEYAALIQCLRRMLMSTENCPPGS